MTGTTLSEKISIDPFNAFVSCQSDQISTGGPLSDLRVAVKDNIAVAGMPFTAGHPLFSTRRATRNAEVIDRLTRDGARLVGVTRTDSGGLGVLTPEVLNPRSCDHVVGGSSGGAAAAVAGGLADVAIGTDTGGSVRIPAACCGIYGFKPSYGIIPLDGVWPLSERFDTIGIMATRLESLRRVTDVLLQACDSTSGRIASKIAVDFRRLSDWQAEVREPIRQKIQSLVRRGVIISEVSLPNWLETLEAHGRLVLADARQVYADVWPKREKELGAAARRALTIAANLTKEEIQSAETAVRHANEMIARVFDTNDIILSPTLPIPPPRRDLRRVTLGGIDLPVSLVMMSETCLANIAGTPALVSTAATSGGQDGGSLQLMAPYGQDSRLFDFAEWMEQMPGP